MDRFDEGALDQGVETVVNGREGDGGHLLLGPGENLVGSGVVAFCENGVVDDLALASGTKAGRRKLLVKDL